MVLLNNLIPKTLLAVCLVLFLNACKKEEKSNNNPVQFNYDLPYIMDVSVRQGSSANMPLEFTLLSGNAENLQLSLTGAPPGISCNVDVSSGKPPFSTDVSVSVVTSVNTGIYPVRLTVNSSTAGEKIYDFNIQVFDPTEPSVALSGFYNEYSTSDTTRNHVVAIEPNIYVPQTINVINFEGAPDTFLAYLDFVDHTIAVPFDNPHNAANIFGTGTFNDSSITLHFVNYIDTSSHLIAYFKRK